MNRPQTRAEFERNFHLLHRKLSDGKYHLPRDLSIDSFERLRRLPNGRMDFLSVDEFARLQANMTAHMDSGFEFGTPYTGQEAQE